MNCSKVIVVPEVLGVDFVMTSFGLLFGLLFSALYDFFPPYYFVLVGLRKGFPIIFLFVRRVILFKDSLTILFRKLLSFHNIFSLIFDHESILEVDEFLAKFSVSPLSF